MKSISLSKNVILLIITCTVLGVSTYAYSAKNKSEDPIALLLQRLKIWTEKTNVEKVHLHLDKSHYALGDHIWFKGIVTAGKTMVPSDQSKILYVDLFDERDSLYNQAIIRLKTGLGWGQFHLPDSLNEGNYRIRAYTNWMKNAGSDFYFSKSLKIGPPVSSQVFVQTQYSSEISEKNENLTAKLTFRNSRSDIMPNLKVNYTFVLHGKNLKKGEITSNSMGQIDLEIPKELKESSDLGQLHLKYTQNNRESVKVLPLKAPSDFLDLQFFPESGHLVAGFPSRVAFKAINANGKGKFIKGEILDNSGTIVSSFESSGLGMGSFFLIPNSGQVYTAKILLEGIEKTFKLPPVESSGYSIQLTNVNGLSTGYTNTNKLNIRVLLSEDRLNKQAHYIVAHQNGKVSFSAAIPNAKALVQLNLPTNEMPSGISTLTLLDDNFSPVAERLVFIQNPIDFMKLEAINLKGNYRKREKMDLEFKSIMSQGITDASFSVSVTNTLSHIPDTLNESHIYSSLLLESDLRGIIENPNSYFQNKSDSTIKALDHLLMTQGWRKIDWKSVQQNAAPEVIHKVEEALTIKGVVQPRENRTIAKAKVILFTNSLGIGVDTITNSRGEFIFDNLNYIDSTRFMVQARNSNNNPVFGVKVLPQSILQPLNADEKLDKDLNFTAWDKTLRNNSRIINNEAPSSLLKGSISLKTVNVKTNIVAKPVIERSSNLNGAGKADIIITHKDIGMAQRLEDILVTRAGSVYNPYGTPNLTGGGKTYPLFVVDGVQIDTAGIPALLNMNMQTVSSIEILKNPMYTSMYGSKAMFGVILINTKTGTEDIDDNSTSSIYKFLAKGFTVQKQFYSPINDSASSSNFDGRTTIYWNPAILADRNGNIRFNYYNSDEAGVYRAVIEGINLNGEIVRKVFYYQVD